MANWLSNWLIDHLDEGGEADDEENGADGKADGQRHDDEPEEGHVVPEAQLWISIAVGQGCVLCIFWPNLDWMLEEHGSVGGHFGDVAGADADVDEKSQDGRDVGLKVEGKHPVD